MALDGAHGVDDWNAGRLGETEGWGRDWGVRLFATEGESRDGTIGLLDFDVRNRAFWSDGEGEALNALLLFVRDPGESEGAIGGG